MSININIPEVIKILKADKKRIAIYCAVAAAIGLLIAFTTPKKYNSTVVLAPEESGQGFSGSLSSLASMVGMNMKLGQTGDALYPEIYPDLVSSTDFILKLFPVKVTTKDGSISCDYHTYITKHQSIALTDYPLAGVKLLIKSLRKPEPSRQGKGEKSDIIWLSRDDDELVKGLTKNISCSVDKKTNVITISYTDQDPLVAATMVDSIKNHLQVAITEYRTKKAKNDLQYMQQLYNEARQQYDKARQSYAIYADANQELELQVYKMKEEDLENDMQLKFNTYTAMQTQLQQAKAKVQERTPAFTLLKGASVPIKPTGPKRMIFVIGMVFLAFFGTIFWIIKDEILKAINKKEELPQ